MQLWIMWRRENPHFIEFWASWCENCEALEPQLDQIQAEWGSKVNVVAVAVAVSQSQRRVKRHAEDQGSSTPTSGMVRARR